MPVTSASLGGVALPPVSARDGYREWFEYRGSDTEMVSGAIGTDLVSTSQKLRIELYWIGLSESAVTGASGVLAAWATVKNSSASFTSPRGGSHTVTRDIGALDVEVNWYSSASGLRADVRMKLREV